MFQIQSSLNNQQDPGSKLQEEFSAPQTLWVFFLANCVTFLTWRVV